MKVYNKVIINIESGETIYEDSYEHHGDIAQCGGGGGGGGDTTTTVRFAPYIETRHQNFITNVATYVATGCSTNPFEYWFEGVYDIDFDTSILGTGYTIASFPSLFDMYGKFLAGLDVDTLFSQIFEDTVGASEVDDLVAAESALMEDDVEEAVTAIELGLRDINSVMSSTFVIARAIPRDTKVKAVEKFRSELKYKLIPIASDRWKTHLEWNKNVAMVYAQFIKLYYSGKMDVENFNHTMASKDALWPFTVLEYERMALGALSGAQNTKSEVEGASAGIGNALSGALSGASMGSSFGGLGAIAGGVLGFAGGLF